MRRLLLTVLVVLALAGACGGGDDSSSDATTTAGGAFALSSPAFGDGELLPDSSAFVDGNESPPLRWSGVPDGIEELALVVVDPDASNFIHWVVAGIDPATTELEAGRLPAGAVEATNSFDETTWSGPAPPAGTRHTYLFTLYALPEPSGVTGGAPGQEAVDLIAEKATARAELRGEYEASR